MNFEYELNVKCELKYITLLILLLVNNYSVMM